MKFKPKLCKWKAVDYVQWFNTSILIENASICQLCDDSNCWRRFNSIINFSLVEETQSVLEMHVTATLEPRDGWWILTSDYLGLNLDLSPARPQHLTWTAHESVLTHLCPTLFLKLFFTDYLLIQVNGKWSHPLSSSACLQETSGRPTPPRPAWA